MRIYSKPNLCIEPFSTEDVITVSAGFDGEEHQWAAAPDFMEYVNDLTVENPSGAFDAQVSGGNPIQEALNTLYENIADLL